MPIWMIGFFVLFPGVMSIVHAEDLELEPVTITAQKTEEDIQKVPMAVSAFSEIQIEDAGIDSSLDLMRFSPNVFMKKSTIENIVLIRGITSYETSFYSPTSFYVDDINLPMHYMHNVNLFDVERVEILKGPQGSLYGRNNEAGVVNIITRQPKGPFSGKVSGELGSYSNNGTGNMKAGLGLNVPIVEEELTLGLFARSEVSEGFMKNRYNDDEEAGKIDHKNYRANLRWTPSSTWDISLIADAVKYDDMIGYYRFMTGDKKTDRFEISHDEEEYSTDTGAGQTLRIRYSGDRFNILSVTGIRGYKNENLQDADCYSDPNADYGGTASIYDSNHMSQEIRLFSPDSTADFKWLFGVYTFKEKTDIIVTNPTSRETRDTDMNIDGNALFAQATYAVSKKLDLTVGVRLDSQSQSVEQKYDYMGWIVNYDEDQDNQETLPKISISFDVNSDLMIYGLVSKGYMSGGYNYMSVYTAEMSSYKPEYTTNREIGMKSSWMNDSLLVNLTYFNIDVTDKQVGQVAPDMTEVRVENAARANSSGFELELAAKPVEGLDITAGIGLIDAKYLEYTASEYTSDYSSIVVSDYSGNKIANIPEYTFNIGLQYRFGTGWLGRADILGTGSAYFDSANKGKMDAYNLVNFRFGYETKTWDAFLYGKNIFDKEYQTAQYWWGDDVLGQDGPPAMFGVSFSYRFNGS